MYEASNSGGFEGILFYLVVIAAYVYFTYAQYRIAQKLRHNTPWLAFIPMVNVIQLIQMAQKSLLWFVFCLVPFVNIICLAILWMDVARRTGNPPLIGVLMIVPLVNFVMIGMMAFGRVRQVEPAGQPVPEQPVNREPQQVG
ncbi:MAG TPA: DUF5684 domain-containing protein [Acidobacteriota bacterium]|nr:DUF5684 domain-containing protein [Acidobacteriota bacterium]